MGSNSEGSIFKVLKKDHVFDNFVKIVNGEAMPITLEDLQEHVKDIQLNQNIPQTIKEIFEISKKLYIHGYFYYRFFTISQHYAFLSLESALKNRYKELFKIGDDKKLENTNLKEIINKLVQQKIIPEDKEQLYDAGRYLRNAFSHLTKEIVSPPSADILERMAELINKLYK